MCLGCRQCPRGVELQMSSIQLVSLLISESMESCFFPGLNRQIDFLILERETSAQAQTKPAPFLMDLNTDLCSEKPQHPREFKLAMKNGI